MWAEPKKGMQLQLLIMVGMVVGVMLTGYLMLPKNQEERGALLERLGTTNHGRLINPVLDVNALALEDESGNAWRHGGEKPKWRMLIPGDGRCLDSCRDLIYATRQVHLRLGKHAHRFERIYVSTDAELSPEFAGHLGEHPYLKVLYTGAAELDNWLAPAGLDLYGTPRAVLVDPGGNAMMAYGAASEGGGILEDLDHLLKYSPGK